jgi:CPA1 family monovalent cation:H+ antiporter
MFGLGVGYIAFLMLRGMDSYPVEILITVALATGGYALAEYFKVSAPLAVVMMGLVVGNHGALSKMSDKTREHLFSFWELIDEVLTLLLFGLIGLEVIGLVFQRAYLVTAVFAIPVVLLARYASVGIPKGLLVLIDKSTRHSVKIMTWGGLRGGISIALALSLPKFPQQDMLIIATYVVVLFSLLVQAPTLGALLRKLKEE